MRINKRLSGCVTALLIIIAMVGIVLDTTKIDGCLSAVLGVLFAVIVSSLLIAMDDEE